MRKLITRGLPVAAILAAALVGGAGSALADPGNGHAYGHTATAAAKPPKGDHGQHKGWKDPAPAPDPVPTYQRAQTVSWSHAVGPYPGEVHATCDPGDVAVENSAAWSLSPEGTREGSFYVQNAPIPMWDAAGSTLIGYGMTFVPVDGTIATTVATAAIEITCQDVTR